MRSPRNRTPGLSATETPETEEKPVPSYPMACFVCGEKIERAIRNGAGFNCPPSGATYWRTGGNYGSTVFDPGRSYAEQLELYICDNCLIERADRVYHFEQLRRIDVQSIRTFAAEMQREAEEIAEYQRSQGKTWPPELPSSGPTREER